MSDTTINPRAVAGDNVPRDATGAIVDRLSSDYDLMIKNTSALLDTARALGETVENERELEGFSNVIVAIRDAGTRAEAARAAEKEPFLRGGQAIDGFFSSIKERLEKARRVLQKRVDDYQARKLAAERLARAELARQQREAAERANREAEEKTRLAEEARLAAERARKPETIETKAAVADQAASEANAAITEAVLATAAAEDARIETLRKPSEIARSRFDEGRLVTMRQVPYCELVDRELVDMVALRHYFTDQEIAKAARGWAKSTGHAKQMPGLAIGFRDEAVVR